MKLKIVNCCNLDIFFAFVYTKKAFFRYNFKVNSTDFRYFFFAANDLVFQLNL